MPNSKRPKGVLTCFVRKLKEKEKQTSRSKNTREKKKSCANLRVLINAVVGPGLAGDVGLGPGLPSSVAVCDVYQTLPYVICNETNEVSRKLRRIFRTTRGTHNIYNHFAIKCTH